MVSKEGERRVCIAEKSQGNKELREVNEGEKKCYHCGISKPLGCFKESNRVRESEQGRCIGCIECTSDPEKVKERILAKYPERNQDWWINEV